MIDYRGILVCNIGMISRRNSGSDGTLNESVLNIKRSEQVNMSLMY